MHKSTKMLTIDCISIVLTIFYCYAISLWTFPRILRSNLRFIHVVSYWL